MRMSLSGLDAALVVLLLTTTITTAVAGTECKTRYGFGPPCLFPYRINGELFFECTTKFFDNSTDAMCPTVLGPDLEVTRERENWGTCDFKCGLMNYRTSEEMLDEIKDLTSGFPDLCSGFVLGASVKDRPLIGIRLSGNIRAGRQSMKPMVRFVANIHGNEAIGRELVLHLATYLLNAYYEEDRIRRLLDTTDIWLLPSINPDGYENAEKGACSGTGRRHGMYNEGNVDLNRDFPSFKDWRQFQTDPNFSVFPGRQPETLSMMDWDASNPFVLSADLHDGAVLVTYPFDFQNNGAGTNLTPDQDLFDHLARGYVDNHPTMKGSTCFRRAEGGMANGAEWYSRNSKGSTAGSMKDFSYLFTNNIQLSLELTCCKYPTRYFILREWENNKESLINYIEQVHMGIKGVVLNADGTPAENADIVVWNPDGSRRGKNVTSFSTGEYWRLLLPGRRVNTGESSFRIQAFLDDCEVSGRRYASFNDRVIVSEKDPLVVKHLFLRHVGFCGVPEIVEQPGRAESLINQIEQFVQATNQEFTEEESFPTDSVFSIFDSTDYDDEQSILDEIFTPDIQISSQDEEFAA